VPVVPLNANQGGSSGTVGFSTRLPLTYKKKNLGAQTDNHIIIIRLSRCPRLHNISIRRFIFHHIWRAVSCRGPRPLFPFNYLILRNPVPRISPLETSSLSFGLSFHSPGPNPSCSQCLRERSRPSLEMKSGRTVRQSHVM
jgi:hypothetical protein